ncbi:MAG: type II toxin-antitoxin system Phd/YefM family antitoxin [Acidobacteriaceae bacterium]|nr:type II toxin-antitoxin system Phd/YefM family antitoxin [Acidobacteriaceae bacterium]MBV9037495.1 type II toxin-antitoxin system Phd/YefM family antitoxin [Acidobacteriaceae bacterium]MBV9226748.1 type II toxin-antitoxin system Phd/YefM family antitoxin [Acidobacteriaceae bacterium]MBV9306288.1 type II toxin-antitoxin system Phd/YefM family antitoxin [Acidobacteriaceae bacterium]
MKTNSVNVSAARGDFAEIINKASYARKRTVISRRGKDVAAVVPIEDLRLLERLAKAELDKRDIADAMAAKEAGEFISSEDFAKEMGW